MLASPTYPDHRADSEVDGKLRCQISRKAFAGVVDRRGRRSQVLSAREADEAISERFMFEQRNMF